MTPLNRIVRKTVYFKTENECRLYIFYNTFNKKETYKTPRFYLRVKEKVTRKLPPFCAALLFEMRKKMRFLKQRTEHVIADRGRQYWSPRIVEMF